MIEIPRLQPNIAEAGLVLDLDFDRKMGNKIIDLSGHRNHGTLVNSPNRVKGHDGRCWAVQSAAGDKYVQVPYNPLFNPGTGSLSFVAWLYMLSSTAEHWLVSRPAGGYYGITFNTSVTHRIYTYFHDGSNSANGYASTAGFPLTTWTHLAVVWDRVAGLCKSYFNGALQAGALDISAVTGSVGNTIDLHIGGRSGASSEFPGYIDNVRLYRRALNIGEIRRLYNNPRARLYGGEEDQMLGAAV